MLQFKIMLKNLLVSNEFDHDVFVSIAEIRYELVSLIKIISDVDSRIKEHPVHIHSTQITLTYFDSWSVQGLFK